MDTFCLTCIASISRSSLRAVTRAEKLAPQATFCLEPFENHDTLFMVFTRWWWGGGYSLIWPSTGMYCCTGYIISCESVLDRVYNFVLNRVIKLHRVLS